MCCFCNQRVHIARVCKSRIVQSSQNKAPDTGDSSKATHQVTQDLCDTNSSEYSYTVHSAMASTRLEKYFTVPGEWQLDELLHQHNSVFEDKL